MLTTPCQRWLLKFEEFQFGFLVDSCKKLIEIFIEFSPINQSCKHNRLAKSYLRFIGWFFRKSFLNAKLLSTRSLNSFVKFEDLPFEVLETAFSSRQVHLFSKSATSNICVANRHPRLHLFIKYAILKSWLELEKVVSMKIEKHILSQHRRVEQ